MHQLHDIGQGISLTVPADDAFYFYLSVEYLIGYRAVELMSSIIIGIASF